MLITTPRKGEQYMLPSKRHVIVDRVYQSENIGCVFVNADGTLPKGRPKTASFTPEFMLRHCSRVR